MSRPRYAWWGYVKSMIRLYPMRMEELRRMQEAKTIAGYGETIGGAPRRATEDLATASLGDQIDREVEAVRLAIEETEGLRDGSERLALIALVFWKRTHTLTGACDVCHVSERTGQQWHGDFIHAVSRYFFRFASKSQNSEVE